ncbi:Endocuticle structural glycoprotein SgAbd-9 [Amphibalanus amphitrite]|uniref:Endocuticle structural glycoprotein SgAbd-9 n=1 Tax=Amphibalanus amphitrite TaxID=1232801 RepID=A0A6A4VKH4_AMPAM|nr:Endocuticle structural glycoprotein SgAbd-9 [Amphibalanus amphitrite]
MFRLLVVCGCLAACLAAPQRQQFAQQQQQFRPTARPSTTTPVPILRQISNSNEDGSYTYGYEAADGSFKLETRKANGEVFGKYGYIDAQGELITIEYGANQHGFQPSGKGITVAPPTLVDESSKDYDYIDEEPVVPVRSQSRPAAPAPARAPVRAAAPVSVARPVAQPIAKEEFDSRTLERFLVEGGGWSLAGAMPGVQAGKLQRIRRLTEQPNRGTAEKPAGAAAAWWLRVRAVIVAVFAVLFLTQAYNPFFVLGLDRNIEIPLGKSIKLELMVEMSKYLNGYGHMCREEPGYTYVGCLRFCFEEKLIEAGPRCKPIDFYCFVAYVPLPPLSQHNGVPVLRCRIEKRLVQRTDGCGPRDEPPPHTELRRADVKVELAAACSVPSTASTGSPAICGQKRRRFWDQGVRARRCP